MMSGVVSTESSGSTVRPPQIIFITLLLQAARPQPMPKATRKRHQADAVVR
jgi:hypothetical protein